MARPHLLIDVLNKNLKNQHTVYYIYLFICHRRCQCKGGKSSTPFTLPVLAVMLLIAAALVNKCHTVTCCSLNSSCTASVMYTIKQYDRNI